jgi:hypothetical protein
VAKKLNKTFIRGYLLLHPLLDLVGTTTLFPAE